MSYQVLARKYRPQTFDEVVGQEAAVTGLRNAIEGNRLGQAFLFSGPRGVGKTSMARILAKALNCEKGPTTRPCGQCEICKGIESGRDADIQEIDAATYSKVENIRELRETIPYGTLRARYKVLIVDEVHRLSPSAFDALLKILEEPPAHVKFVFATTELRKVPDTILSRCELHEFRRIEEGAIVGALRGVCKKERVEAEEDLLRAIAKNAQGALRDSLTLLDQVVAYAGTRPTLADLENASGLAGEEALYGLFEKVLANDRRGILEGLDALWGRGLGEEEFLGQAVDFLRKLLLAKACGPQSALVRAGSEERERIASLVASLPAERIDRMLTLALSAREKGGLLGGSVRVLAELALLRMARTAEELPYERMLALLSRTPESPRAPWKALLEGLGPQRRSFAEVLSRKGSVRGLEGSRFRVEVAEPTPIEKSILGDRKNLDAAERILGEALGRPASLALEFTSGKTARSAETDSSPVVRQVLDLFEGKVVEEG